MPIRNATKYSKILYLVYRLLNCAGAECTVGSLVQQLRALDREDAVHLLLTYTPTYVLMMSVDSETGSNLSR